MILFSLKNISKASYFFIFFVFLSIILFSYSNNIYAATSHSTHSIHIEKSNSSSCWDAAAKYHHVDPWLLYAIAYVESSHHPKVISKPNNNGTYDIGLMQINSVWLPTLKKYGITKSVLLNSCASTYVGAWILAKGIKKYGYTWKAIASYNVGSLNNPTRTRIGYRYAQKVYEAYNYLTSTLNVSPSLSQSIAKE